MEFFVLFIAVDIVGVFVYIVSKIFFFADNDSPTEYSDADIARFSKMAVDKIAQEKADEKRWRDAIDQEKARRLGFASHAAWQQSRLDYRKGRLQDMAIQRGFGTVEEMLAANQLAEQDAKQERENKRISKGKKMIQGRKCDSCGGALSIVSGDFVCEYCGSYYGSVKQIVNK